METRFIIPTVFTVSGLWLLTPGLKGHRGEHLTEGTHFVVTRSNPPARFTQQLTLIGPGDQATYMLVSPLTSPVAGGLCRRMLLTSLLGRGEA